MTTVIATQSDNQAMQELLSENLGGMALSTEDLIKIAIPAGGGTTWEIPTGAGDEVEPAKAIRGVVIAQLPLRLAFGDDKTLLCKSEDGKVGTPSDVLFAGPKPSGTCATCPLNQWGSKGKGKACADKMRLYIMREGDVLPILITLPPTSLANWRKYAVALATGARKAFYSVKTIISLKKIVPDGRDPYTVVQFTGGEACEEGEAQYYADFRINFIDMLKATLEADTPMSDDEFMNQTHPNSKPDATKDDAPTF